MKNKRKSTATKRTASLVESRKITLWTRMFAALEATRKQAFAKIDPGKATICAAFVVASATSIPNIHKIWVGNPLDSSVESIVAEKESNFAELTTDLGTRSSEMKELKQDIQKKGIADGEKALILAAIDKYEVANQRAKSRLVSHHSAYKNDLRANNLAGANHHQGKINDGLTEEALEYNRVHILKDPQQTQVSPIRFSGGRYSSPPVFPLPPEQTPTETTAQSRSLGNSVHSADKVGRQIQAEDYSLEFREGLSPR